MGISSALRIFQHIFPTGIFHKEQNHVVLTVLSLPPFPAGVSGIIQEFASGEAETRSLFQSVFTEPGFYSQ